MPCLPSLSPVLGRRGQDPQDARASGDRDAQPARPSGRTGAAWPSPSDPFLSSPRQRARLDIGPADDRAFKDRSTGGRRGFATALAVAGIAACLAGLPGCKRSFSDRDIQWVDPDQAIKEMTARTGTFGLGGAPNGVWLDPRSPASFEKGHIPGAVSMPFPTIEAQYPTLRDKTVIVVYDSDYSDTIARAASKTLMELGHKNVKTLRGGLAAWEREGHPVETGAAP